MLHQQGRIQALQIKALAARQNRDRYFTNLGGGEDEFHMRRRLFQSFQQRVESAFRKHVHFVDDINFIARLHGRITHAIDNLAHVINASVGCGIHLDHVNMARFQNGFTTRCHFRHIHGRAVWIVERSCYQPRRSGFANAAHACEHIALGNPACGESIGQGAHQRFLTNQIRKILRAIFAGKNAVTRSVLCCV